MTDEEVSPNDESESVDLETILHSANEKLDETGRINANQAFNLGCLIGLIPAALVVLLVFIITQASWLAALITGILMLIALVGLANLAALRARTKTMERVYATEVKPKLERTRQQMDLTPAEFDQLAWQTVPDSAVLHTFLNKPEIFAVPNADEEGNENDD
jgi:hypothetical protein